THRMAIAQTIITTAQQAPQLHDMREAYSRFYSAMGVNDVDKLLPPPEQVAPADPVSENMTLFKGGKAQAGPDQNHEAHIQSHYAFLDDPRYGALEDPSLDGVRAALKAHIAEHMAFRYRQEIEQIIGGPLPIGQPVPKQVEDQIALAVASASAALASSSRSMVEKPLSKEDIKVLELEQRRREADQKFSLGKESNIIEAGKVSLEAAAKGVELDLTAEQIAKENINAT
ncbi:MAG: hypothetical protein EBR82_72460, partial [Caulobacteraceae bacterium]|nr:hypothetical protein [Caulobacteraceae bacterium]